MRSPRTGSVQRLNSSDSTGIRAAVAGATEGVDGFFAGIKHGVDALEGRRSA